MLLALVTFIGFLACNVICLILSLLTVFQRKIRLASIGWVNCCHNGGKKDGLAKTMMGTSTGALVGMASVMLTRWPVQRVRQLRDVSDRMSWLRRDGVDDAPLADLDEPSHVLRFQPGSQPNYPQQGHDICDSDCAFPHVNRRCCRLRLAVAISGLKTGTNLTVAPAKVAT